MAEKLYGIKEVVQSLDAKVLDRYTEACPHCGRPGKSYIERSHKDGSIVFGWVGCPSCKMTRIFHDDEQLEEAFRVWNSRVNNVYLGVDLARKE